MIMIIIIRWLSLQYCYVYE